MNSKAPILAASAVVRDESGRILLVRRATPPRLGHWTIPGGRHIQGESLEETAVREVREETGLDVRIVRKLGQVLWTDEEGTRYEIHDFLAEWLSGEAIAADDAAEVGWFTSREVAKLTLTKDLLSYLIQYGVYS